MLVHDVEPAACESALIIVRLISLIALNKGGRQRSIVERITIAAVFAWAIAPSVYLFLEVSIFPYGFLAQPPPLLRGAPAAALDAFCRWPAYNRDLLLERGRHSQ